MKNDFTPRSTHSPLATAAWILIPVGALFTGGTLFSLFRAIQYPQEVAQLASAISGRYIAPNPPELGAPVAFLVLGGLLLLAGIASALIQGAKSR